MPTRGPRSASGTNSASRARREPELFVEALPHVLACCPEATTAPLHRAALGSPDAVHTALTNLFTGRPARGIVNRVMREIGPLNRAAPAFPLAAAAMAPLRAAAEARGSTDFTPLWAGQNTRGCRAVPAAELLASLARGIAEADQ